MLVDAGLQARGEASIWSASGLAASRSANWVSIRASRSSSSGSPTGRDSSSHDRRSQLGERPRLLVESRGGSGVLGQHGQPLLERDQRVVQRDDLIRRDDVLDPGSESAQPAFDLDRVGDRAIRELRNALLDRGQ